MNLSWHIYVSTSLDFLYSLRHFLSSEFSVSHKDRYHSRLHVTPPLKRNWITKTPLCSISTCSCTWLEDSNCETIIDVYQSCPLDIGTKLTSDRISCFSSCAKCSMYPLAWPGLQKNGILWLDNEVLINSIWAWESKILHAFTHAHMPALTSRHCYWNCSGGCSSCLQMLLAIKEGVRYKGH